MARLPIPGSDDGTWGDILNDYLAASHKADGTLKNNVVGSAQLQDNSVDATVIADGSITETQLDTAVQAKLNDIAPVTSVNTQTGDVSLTKSDIGLDNVDNTSDTNKPISTAVQTALDTKAATTLTDALDNRLDVLEAPSVALTDAGTIAISAATGKFHHVTLGGNRTLGNPSGAYNGQLLLITVAQDAMGNRTVALDTKYRLPAGLTLGWSTAANRKDKLLVQYDGADDRFDVLAFQAGYGA